MTDLSPLQRFLARVRLGSQNGSKDIRLTIGEALELTATLAQMLTDNYEKPKMQPSQPISIKLDGGAI